MTVSDSIALISMIVALAACLSLATIVGTSHAKRSVRRSFVWTLAMSSLWVGSNTVYQLLETNDPSKFWAAQAAYVFAAWAAIAFLFFVAKFTDWRSRFITVTAIVGSVGAVLFGVPNFLATGLDEAGIETTGWIVLYCLVMVGILVTAVVRLAVALRFNSGRMHQQISGMLWAVSVFAVLALFFNLLLPVFGIYNLVALGPVSIIFFVVMASYSVLAYGLFGVRSMVAKVMTFLLTVLALLAVGLVLLFIFGLLGFIKSIPSEYTLILLALLIVMTAIFQPLQRFLARITDNLFYKNSYDVDRLSQELIVVMFSNVTVGDLLGSSARVIGSTLKASSVSFILPTEDNSTIDCYGAKKRLTSDELNVLDDFLASVDDDVAIMDEINSTNPIRRIGHDRQIDIVVRLRARSNSSKPTAIGYVLVGEKAKSAGYNSRDIMALNIAANLISLAMENTRYYERVQSFNEQLEQEIDRATAELRQSNRKLQKLDIAKDDFISMASHQLRTPLTLIRGYLSMLLDNDIGKLTDEQRRVLGEAYIGSERMAYLISDFLDISRLQTGKFELQKTATQLAEVLDTEIDQFRVTATARDIKLDYSADPKLPVINCDKNKLRQVMINMIDNAIYYSHAGGTIEIKLTFIDGQIVFEVRDYGIGVPIAERDKIFTRFFRASNARRVRPDGTGIGLYLAHKIVTAHHGTVIFECHEKHGSTFGFKLPMAKTKRTPVSSDK
jgi:signal transduction histidine kinase